MKVFVPHLKSDLNLLRGKSLFCYRLGNELLKRPHKFTTQGRVTIYARFARQQAGADKILIGVVDTGEGIPADKTDLVFDRFQQLDDRPERRQLGSGLGLAICRELVEMHGGRIWVESKPGAGSDFKFTLPVLRVVYFPTFPTNK